MVETRMSGGGNNRLGAKSDAETGGAQHRQVVGAVADRERKRRWNAEFAGKREQSLPLCLGGDDRRQHPAGQPAVDDLQPVGDDAVEAELRRDRLGEDCEPAGDERGRRTGAPHRRHERAGAGSHTDPGGGLGEHADVGPGQQRDAGGERAGELDLAVHRPPRDLGDARSDPEDQPELVEHLVFDDRRFEIGGEQPLAPAGLRLNHDVDRGACDQRAGGFGDIIRKRSVEKQVAGFCGRKPHGRGTDRELVANRGGEPEQAAFPGGGDQGYDEAHRPSSYAAGRLAGKHEGAPPVVIVAGPTASGKSALALALAEQWDAAVINADALQCCRDLEILTARPDAAALARVPHRLYGFLDAAERGSAGAWRTLALSEIAAATNAGRLPILVGGTGLYLRALQHGLAPFPEIPDAIRTEAAALHCALGGAAFREELAALDAASARRLHPADSQRLVRAYAVARATGIPVGAWRRRPHATAPYRFATILIMPPRDRLYAACDMRFAAMIESGALAEAAALAARALDPDLPAMKALGLPELLRHLHGETTLAAAVAAAQQATRRYAKRQMTWFRHQSQPDLVLAEQFSESLLHRSRQFIDEFLLTGRG